MPNCSKQRLLKVVRIENSWIGGEININMFKRSTLLRYLYLHGRTSDDRKGRCLMKVLGCLEKVIGDDNDYFEKVQGSWEKVIGSKSDLEKVICSMKFLQTLDTRLRTSQAFSDCVWPIKTLRHVISSSYMSPLPSSTKLTNLQTLVGMETKKWKTEFPHLPNLRTLNLSHHSSSWGIVVAFLGTLRHLITLRLRGPFSLDIIDMKNFPFYQHLQSLELIYTTWKHPTPIEIAIDHSMFPPHLTYLCISRYSFQQDIMLVLEKLHYLKRLVLFTACNSKKMSCSATGFSQLEVLDLCSFDLLEDWEIEEEAMPILRELTIKYCRRLCVPQGLRHLTNLQELTCIRNENMKDRADEVRSLCKRVPSIKFI